MSMKDRFYDMSDIRSLIIGRGQLGCLLQGNMGCPSELHYKGDIADLCVGWMKEMDPDVIVSCAGKTDLDWCEVNHAETWRVNVASQLRLWQNIIRAFGEGKKKKKFIHFSSGCIWDGPYDEKDEPFGPEHTPCPASYYAWTKAACDALMMDVPSGAVSLHILRPRQVYTPVDHPRNTLQKLMRYERLIDAPNSMTSITTILKTVQAVAEAKEAPMVMNVYDKGITSPFAVCEKLAKAKLRPAPKRMSLSELNRSTKTRRVNVVMKDEAFEALVDPAGVEATLDSYIKMAIEAKEKAASK